MSLFTRTSAPAPKPSHTLILPRPHEEKKETIHSAQFCQAKAELVNYLITNGVDGETASLKFLNDDKVRYDQTVYAACSNIDRTNIPAIILFISRMISQNKAINSSTLSNLTWRHAFPDMKAPEPGEKIASFALFKAGDIPYDTVTMNDAFSDSPQGSLAAKYRRTLDNLAAMSKDGQQKVEKWEVASNSQFYRLQSSAKGKEFYYPKGMCSGKLVQEFMSAVKAQPIHSHHGQILSYDLANPFTSAPPSNPQDVMDLMKLSRTLVYQKTVPGEKGKCEYYANKDFAGEAIPPNPRQQLALTKNKDGIPYLVEGLYPAASAIAYCKGRFYSLLPGSGNFNPIPTNQVKSYVIRVLLMGIQLGSGIFDADTRARTKLKSMVASQASGKLESASFKHSNGKVYEIYQYFDSEGAHFFFDNGKNLVTLKNSDVAAAKLKMQSANVSLCDLCAKRNHSLPNCEACPICNTLRPGSYPCGKSEDAFGIEKPQLEHIIGEAAPVPVAPDATPNNNNSTLPLPPVPQDPSTPPNVGGLSNSWKPVKFYELGALSDENNGAITLLGEGVFPVPVVSGEPHVLKVSEDYANELPFSKPVDIREAITQHNRKMDPSDSVVTRLLCEVDLLVPNMQFSPADWIRFFACALNGWECSASKVRPDDRDANNASPDERPPDQKGDQVDSQGSDHQNSETSIDPMTSLMNAIGAHDEEFK